MTDMSRYVRYDMALNCAEKYDVIYINVVSCNMQRTNYRVWGIDIMQFYLQYLDNHTSHANNRHDVSETL